MEALYCKRRGAAKERRPQMGPRVLSVAGRSLEFVIEGLGKVLVLRGEADGWARTDSSHWKGQVSKGEVEEVSGQ